MGREELTEEYKQIEDAFYTLYESAGLPYDLYEDDPLHTLTEGVQDDRRRYYCWSDRGQLDPQHHFLIINILI